MKRAVQRWLVVCSIFSAGLTCGDDSQVTTVRVGIFPVEPLNFMDQRGVARGLNPDLLREIASRQKSWQPEFVSVNWAEGLEKLQSEEIDLMVSVSFSTERAKVLDYSREPVMEVWGQVFVRPDADIVSSLDLEMQPVGIMRRDINGRNFKKLALALGVECEMVEYETHADIFSAVSEGEIMAGVAPNHFGFRHARTYGLVGTSIQFSPSPIYYASKKGRLTEVMKNIDSVLSDWKQDGNSFYYRRLEYWFGVDQPLMERIPLWLRVVVAGAMSSTLLLIVLSWLFKHQVRLRTKELAESEERYRILIESHSDLVVKVDREGRFIYVSPTYCELFGKSEKALLGNNFMPLVHEDDRVSTEIEFQKIFDPPHQAYMEQRALTKRGWRWLSWQNSAILDKDGEVAEIIGVGRDITDHREAEKDLRDNTNRLRLATGAAHIGIWEYEFSSDRLIWDNQMFLLYNVEPLQFEGNFNAWQKCLHSDDLEHVTQLFKTAVKEHIPFSAEMRVVWADGSIHHLRALAETQYDAGGNPVRVIGANWDVSRHHQMVAALKVSEQDYRQLFENMTTGFVALKVVEGDDGLPVDYRIVQVNRAAEEMAGTSRSNLIGFSISEIFQPMEKSWLIAFAKVVESGKPLAFEHRAETIGRILSTWIFVSKPGQLGIVISDSTARHMAEDEMRRARQQLQHIVNNTRDIIFQVDLQGNYIYVNATVNELTGYSEAEILSMNMMQLVAPEYHQKVVERMTNCLKGDLGRGIYSFEIIHKKGHRVWLELATSGVFDAQGKLEAVQGVARDVTERIEAERELEESRHFLRTIIDTIPVRLYWKDLKSIYQGCNLSFARDSGVELPDGLVGKSDFDMSWGKTEADSYRADDAAVMKSGESRINFEECQTRPDGSQCWLNASKVPIRNAADEIVGVLGVYQDITDRKRLEEERMRLSAAINQSAEAVVIMDLHWMVKYVNPAFETVTGFTREEAIGQNLSIIKSGKHDDDFYSNIWKTIEAGESWSGRIVNKHKNGSFYTVEATISPVKFGGEDEINYVVTTRDVSEQLELEADMRQAQKMDAVGRLAGGVAHDFNNILQSILGFSGILLSELEEGSSQYDDVSEIRKATHRASDLTRQLLTLSRKHHIEYTVQSLNDTIRRNERMMRRLIGENIEFVFDLDGALRPIRADISQIEQIILNLFINARDAMPDGGRLLVKTSNVKATDDVGTDTVQAAGKECICLSVSDSGCGIRDDVREHLFEPFFTTKRVGEGTGLGLSMVYGIVQQHGGWIDVVSTVGQGAEFRVYLPTYINSSPGEEMNRKRYGFGDKSPSGHGEFILVVEDDDTVRELSERMLRDAGYRVAMAANCEAAFQMLDSSDDEVDLLLSDVVLPDGNGVEMAREIRRRYAHVPVLLCSGYVQDAAAFDIMSANDFRFLEKPVAIMQLLQTVWEMLDEKRSV